MSRSPRYALTWSRDRSRYELFVQNQLDSSFDPTDETRWLTWLAMATAFAFHGQNGCLNIYQETRRGGKTYWYAYHTTRGRTRKRYLGQTDTITFARLEEAAQALACEPSLEHLASGNESPQGETISSPRPDETELHLMPLATRLVAPHLPTVLVTRERLLLRLDEARTHRLTLLSASAGWGKTTLLAAWAERSCFPVAWLALDERDNDPVRFWISLIAALRTCLPELGEVALALLRSPQPPAFKTILNALFQDVHGLSEALFLVLGDYHLITEQAVHDALLVLLEHLPAPLHLMISSRIDPPFPLSRHRVRGQLLEIRAADLRFDDEEAAQFLTHTMHLALETEEMRALTQRTEGWIAGLQLAALAMQQRADRSAFVRSFTGSNRYLVDYVREEILAHMPEAFQTFLLHTAVLSQLSAELCQAVSTEYTLTACQELLEQAERANLFLVPLDDERRWYRMHDLFREALLACLKHTQPTLVPVLHQRAARWYEAQGSRREAIEHLLAAADYPSAAVLIEHMGEEAYLQGEVHTVSRWIMALPDEVPGAHSRLALTTALYLISFASHTTQAQQMKGRTQAERLLTRVETTLQGGGELPAPEQALLRRRLLLLRLWSSSYEVLMHADREQYDMLAQQIQQLDEDEEAIWRSLFHLPYLQ